MGKIEILIEKRKELIERINVAVKYRKEVIDKVQKLAARFSLGELSFFEYYSHLKHEFGDKTPEEWTEYYDKYIEKCNDELKKCGEKIRKIRTGGIAKRVVPLVIFLIFTFSIYYYLSVVKEKPVLFSPIEGYVDDVNFFADENMSFIWTPKNTGELNSLKISGEIVGGGNVKVYLEGNGKEFLVLDSNDLSGVEGNGLTGKVIAGINETTDLDGNVSDVKNDVNVSSVENNVSDVKNNTEVTKDILVKRFNNYCKETCDLSTLKLSEESYNLRVEIVGNAEIKTDKFGYELVQKENLAGTTSPLNESLNESVDGSFNDTLSKNYTLNETFNIVKAEKRNEKGKEIKIGGKQGLKNVEVNSKIPLEWRIKDSGSIRVYWKEANKDIDFNTNDLNNDGYIDEVNWTIEDLAVDQTFEIIIITKAEHLDSDRTFISDIYEQVKELDGNWSETIGDREYVRVTFEIPLDNTKDITVYARAVSGSPIIGVYEVNDARLITTFPIIENESYYKVYLTNLSNSNNHSQDTFDLRVLGGSVELEHVIDPFAFPGGTAGNIELRPQGCARQDQQTSQNTFNLACDGTYPSNTCQSTGDRISCDDSNFETATFKRGQYGGINASYFNSTIGNCFSIINVSLCYKDWGFVPNQVCNMGVDANGGASWTNIPSTCLSSEPFSILCIDVTSLENWQCNNFFGASGIRALAKSQTTRTGGKASIFITWTFDTLFFNVTYNVTPVIITEVNATKITQNSAIINWTTNVLANSSVNYNSTASLGTIIKDLNFVIKHNISLTGLLTNTIYYYNVTSCSSDNICSTNGTFNFTTLAPPNQAPTIGFVGFTNIGAILGGVRDVSINFSAMDLNGVGNLNDLTARVEIYNSSKGVAPGMRVNSSCSFTGSSANTRNYTCTIGMWYFDPYGYYIVNATIADNGGLTAENSSKLFNYQYTYGFTPYPNALSWGMLNPGDVNKPSIENLTINNTGNVNFTRVNITAYNLSGVSDSSYYIPAKNFYASVNPSECGLPASQLNHAVNVSISSFSSLAPGNLSSGGGVGQEQLFFCLAQVPSPLFNQLYSTGVGIPWEIALFAAPFVLGRAGGINRKKKKRNIVLEKEDLLELFGDKLEELLEIVKENKLKKQLGQTREEKIEIPLGIFRENIGAAESLCKYLKENKGLRFAEIARMLNRDRRTIGLNYKNAAASMKREMVVGEGEIYVSLEIFADRKLSILESVVYYLRVGGYKNVEISRMLGKDQRNVWTLYSRAMKKLKS